MLDAIATARGSDKIVSFASRVSLFRTLYTEGFVGAP